ncbi:MAG: AbrB/MazE/SpoVT family DNA-binding domain-containing protein [Dehalococcoidia bacterium]|nr:AbrB/MazE/SpoVT family DNA-binding domain-containing protein [Dehalococcoidia bacterium]MCA9825169.1 AbrB/MazE/SpoVT family DNA-binding domain-containing protein [Dehalococcoidia bacterium]MCA9845414.1 AbrB/MazE/SpoVT family DNA-binding domain-containing protein [Dehalococcoidia bacterium]
MRGKVSRWGNSLAVRIPKAIAEEAGIAENAVVEIRNEDTGIVVEPTRDSDDPTLDELLEGLTPDKVHGEFDWGPPAGKEVW